MTTSMDGSGPTLCRPDAVVPELPVPDNPSSPNRVLPQCVAGTDSGYSSIGVAGSTHAADSVRAESADVEDFRANDDGTRGPDRRGETIPSQSNTETPSEGALPNPGSCLPPKPFPLADREDLCIIRHAPAPNIRQRWSNIVGPLSRGLKEELQKSVSMRLVMLGTADGSPVDARPCIVVFCSRAQWKRVRKFFEQREVRELYRPPGSDPDLPSFDFYLGPPLQQKAQDDGVDVFSAEPEIGDIHQEPGATLCGTSIQLQHLGSSYMSIATLGGIVKVVDATNHVACYGLTAGHIMPLNFTGATVSWKVQQGPRIGTVVDECLEQCVSEHGGYYDWALCHLSRFAPNCLQPQEHAPRRFGDEHHARLLPELRNVDKTFRSAVDDIPVIVMTGSGGSKKGWLSTLCCPVMFGPGTEFIAAFTVSFPQPGAIRDGDSGSWVVNEHTLEVIGHIVATDELDDAYAIPLMDIFEDIKVRFAAKSVKLASASSIRSLDLFLGPHARAGAPQLDAIRGNVAYQDSLRHDPESPPTDLDDDQLSRLLADWARLASEAQRELPRRSRMLKRRKVARHTGK